MNAPIARSLFVRRERAFDSRAHFTRILDANACRSHRLGHLGEVRVLELGPEVPEARHVLLELDQAERAVVVDDDLHGQTVLDESDEVTPEYGYITLIGGRTFRLHSIPPERVTQQSDEINPVLEVLVPWDQIEFPDKLAQPAGAGLDPKADAAPPEFRPDELG